MAKIFFANDHLPEKSGDTHFMVVGTTGSGKTVTFKLFMNSLIPSFFAPNPQGILPDRRAVIFDEKQDIYSFLRSMRIPPQRIYLTNPFDRRCHAWNMAKDITGPDTALQVASIFIPEENNSTNRYFSDAARAILTGVMRTFIQTCRAQPTGARWGLSDLLAVMRNPDVIRHVLSQTEDGKELVALHLQAGKTANDILSTAGAFLAPFEVVGALWKQAEQAGRLFSLRDFLHENAILILGNNQEARAPIEAINRLVFQRLTQLVLALPENPRTESQKRRIWFFLDELRKLGKLPGLDDLMNNGRSKGANVIIGFQDIQGLRAVYGEEVADELISMCNSFVVLRLSGIATPKWAAELFGEQRGREEIRNEGIQNTMSGGMTFSSGQGEHSYQRTLFFDSTFKQIPIVQKPKFGISGYYFSPYIVDEHDVINPFPETLPWSAIDAHLPQETPDERAIREEGQRLGHEQYADFCPWRDESVKYLKRLTTADYERLHITLPKTVSAPSEEDAQSQGRKMRFPKKGSTYEEAVEQLRGSG